MSLKRRVDSLHQHVRQRVLETPLPKFWRWWLGQLEQCLPGVIESALQRRRPQAIPWPWHENVAPTPRNAPVTLLIAPSQTLECTLWLPQKANAKLQAVVGYEIDRYTPLQANQVYFEAVAKAPAVEGMLEVVLTVIERSRLESAVQQATDRGLKVTCADVAKADGTGKGLNLMREAQGLKPVRGRFQSRIWTAIILALLVACPLTWLGNRQQALDDMAEQVANLRVRALQVDAMRKQLQARAQIEQALSHGSASPSPLAVLATLTSCIGPDTWLEQVDLRADGSVLIRGASRQASALPDALMLCAHLERATFQGTVQTDPARQEERFTLTAQRPGVSP